ncbi:hypothetical protein X777_01872 [Ooceraea biroi]|uniref:Uncharacterized protein n=1 Tax=Ooceraea biroi TaxID=2015173 RepID=A0A026WST6_OOCBI|nr:hypothetical protein X777_01872 [Ooceraea biroi]
MSSLWQGDIPRSPPRPARVVCSSTFRSESQQYGYLAGPVRECRKVRMRDKTRRSLSILRYLAGCRGVTTLHKRKISLTACTNRPQGVEQEDPAKVPHGDSLEVLRG